MAAPAERTFWKSIQSKAFLDTYYVYGDDEYLKEQAVRQLIAAAVDPATRDFNLDSRNAGDLDVESLGSLLNTPPMMAERRVVVVRDVASLRKAARAALDDHIARTSKRGASSADVVVVLVAAGGERAKPDKALQKLTGAVEFAPLSGDCCDHFVCRRYVVLTQVCFLLCLPFILLMLCFQQAGKGVAWLRNKVITRDAEFAHLFDGLPILDQ
jgi:DNA polymerase-3 subunit delta